MHLGRQSNDARVAIGLELATKPWSIHSCGHAKPQKLQDNYDDIPWLYNSTLNAQETRHDQPHFTLPE